MHSKHYAKTQQCPANQAANGSKVLGFFSSVGIQASDWSNNTVGVVGTAWSNVIFSPDSIDEKDLNDLIAELRQLNAKATPVSAEGDLYAILDLLRHARTQSGLGYLPMMRRMLKDSLQRYGNPSAGVVLHAWGLVAATADDPVEALSTGLSNPDWRVRVACVRALKEIEVGRDDPAIIPALAGALADSDVLVREIAADSLQELGPRAISTGPALAQLFGQEPSKNVRWHAVSAFRTIGCKDPSVLKALVSAMNTDPSESIRTDAVEVLGELAPQSEETIQALEAVLGDPIDTVRATAAKVLVRIGPPLRVSPAVLGYLKQEIAPRDSTTWAMGFIEELHKLGPEARTVLPLLINELKRTDDLNVRAPGCVRTLEISIRMTTACMLPWWIRRRTATGSSASQPSRPWPGPRPTRAGSSHA